MPPKKSKSPKKVVEANSANATATDDDAVASRYKKVSHVDHILLRPEMYVGSIENHKQTQWLFVPGAEPTENPHLLPPGDYEKRLAELHMNTVKLQATKGKKKEDAEGGDDSGEGAAELDESSIDDQEQEEEVKLVNGVDKRLLVSHKTVTAFGQGSQVVDKVFINPGLLKIVDEIVVNAADNRLVPSGSDTPQSYIRVTFDESTGEITCQNDGAAIPIVKHPEHGIYVPEMIFGSLLTSSHYGNDPNSIAAGRHGFGAKLTNILSSRFTVECVKDGMKFVGVWTENMKHKESVKVSPVKYQGAYTKVSFIPEYTRFTAQDLAKVKEASSNGAAVPDGLIPSDFNIIAELGKILKRRLLDLSASIGNSLEVFYNDEKLSPNDFAEYVRMHMPEKDGIRQPFVQSSTSKSGNALACDYGIMVLPPQKNADGTAAVQSQPNHVSLVNGIVTHQGGTHLRHLSSAFDQALEAVAAHLEKEERLMLNTALLKANTTLFVNVLVHQSKFDSQSKDRLVSKHTYAAVKTQDLFRHILLLPFIRYFCLTSDKMTAALESAIVSMGAKQKNLMRQIPKLVEPADMTIPMHRTLILTEGDSAKALALNSLSSDQRTNFGVLPLRGKVLNVRNAHPRKIAANKEIVHILAALGLSTKKKFSTDTELRYQRVLIMTDQDYDGFHIRGLIISLINYYWPELMKNIPNYVSIFSTPIIKARVKGQTTPFYSIADYKKWLEAQPEAVVPSIKIKYYKGLGTSTTEEGREYFNSMEDNVRFIKATDADKDAELMNKAFSSDEECVRWRKHWVLSSKVVDDMESGRGSLTINDFVNQQLIQFALADNLRSFPDIRDGLRLSYRKILWAMLQRKSTDSMRVSQCAGYVSEASNYHHGEASLIGCIVNLAQSHVGSNNVPLLLGEGQFGSRINAGRDAAAARYIFTNIAPFARKLFPAADDELLQYDDQEGSSAEPVAYAPVLPMQFINGATSIGVGFASRHIPHDVSSVIATVNAMLKGKSAAEAAKHMRPGVAGFRGIYIADPAEPKRSIVAGDFELYSVGREIPPAAFKFGTLMERRAFKELGFPVKSHTLIRVTEIPYMMAIEDYRKAIAEKLDAVIVTLTDHSGANHVDIRITVDTRAFMAKLRSFTKAGILDYMNLSCTVSQFMVCISNGTVQSCGHRYEEQLQQFYDHRLEVYNRRLSLTQTRLREEIKKLDGHIKFTQLIKSKGSNLLMLSEPEIIKALEEAKVPQIDGSYKSYLNRSIASLLKESADNLQEKLKTTKQALEHSEKNDTPIGLWAADLKEFAVHYAAYETKLAKTIADEYKVASGKRALGAAIGVDVFTGAAGLLGYTASTKRSSGLLGALEFTAPQETLVEAESAATNIVEASQKRSSAAKKALDSAKKAFKGRGGASAAAAAGGAATSAGGGLAASASGGVSAMVAPSGLFATMATTALAFPAYDVARMAAQRRVGMGAGIAGRSLLRMFGRTLL